MLSSNMLFSCTDFYIHGEDIRIQIYDYDSTYFDWESSYNKYHSDDLFEAITSFIESLGHQVYIHYDFGEQERYLAITFKGRNNIDEFKNEEMPKFEKLLLDQWNNIWSKVTIPTLKELIMRKLRSDNRTFLLKSVVFATKLYGADTTLDLLRRYEIIYE